MGHPIAYNTFPSNGRSNHYRSVDDLYYFVWVETNKITVVSERAHVGILSTNIDGLGGGFLATWP